MTRSVFAPAKLNLTLDVLPRRTDGYHDLDSLVVRLTRGDTLHVTTGARCGSAPRIRFTCSDPSLPTDSTNLAVLAAERFCARVRETETFDLEIHLEKRLPHQAGLGGGSSDAAAVLTALNASFPISASVLHEIAAGIGSDVALFLLPPGAIRMRGRGEQVERTPFVVPKFYGVVIQPVGGVSTRHAYAHLDARANRGSGTSTAQLIRRLERGADLGALAAGMHNDFEEVILSEYPAVAQAHEALHKSGALRALLCGSGSAVFGLAADRDHANTICARFGSQFPYAQVVHSDFPGGVS